MGALAARAQTLTQSLVEFGPVSALVRPVTVIDALATDERRLKCALRVQTRAVDVQLALISALCILVET